jgi:aminopeptidase N
LESGWLWDFGTSDPISSYIYCLCAGNYHEIPNTDPAPTPMRIYCRKSRAGFVDSKEIFRVISEGIGFYEVLFGCKFPFKKYDVIYCPEYRIGAMENVGAVTFNDLFLKPADQQTDRGKLFHSYVHLHELAHMWFGDLTTMIWWNDLWLKESFADFCSATCMNETPSLSSKYKDPQILFLSFVTAALRADLKPTTHPIRVGIKHTGDGETAFDAIPYQKGASWIKTMDNFIGRKAL